MWEDIEDPHGSTSSGRFPHVADGDVKAPTINSVVLRKWRGPSPLGHIAPLTAAFAALRRSGGSAAVVTPARMSQADAKSSTSNPSTSVSTRASTPTSANCFKNGPVSASAPGPTPGTGDGGAKLPAIC